MSKASKAVRKILVAAIGFPLLAVGLILIPLPGPGVLISLAAFFVLSLEFDWAAKHFESAKGVIKKIYQDAKARADRIENAGSKHKSK